MTRPLRDAGEWAPLFRAAPPLRCQRPLGSRPRIFCGELARWMRPGNDLFMPAYFCDAHHEQSDVAIPAAGIMRRVRVQVEVLFAGASWTPKDAEAEAVARLESAVKQAGGVFSLTSAASHVGRFDTKPGPDGENGGPSDPE